MAEPTSAQDLFKGRHFDQEIIILCVRWYLAFKLSSRDLVQMMAERGILLAHTTILRWVQRYVPDFEKRWQAYARPVGDSWRVDETYIKVKGQWVYLYRAVDKAGRTVDFLLSRRRDMAAAKRFFSRATKQHGAPRVITLDGYAASHRAVAKLKTSGILPCRVQVRSCKYLNNVIEQDHRRRPRSSLAPLSASQKETPLPPPSSSVASSKPATLPAPASSLTPSLFWPSQKRSSPSSPSSEPSKPLPPRTPSTPPQALNSPNTFRLPSAPSPSLETRPPPQRLRRYLLPPL